MISHPFELRFWSINYHFEGKNMPYETVQNSTRSNSRIKKWTFWPCAVRVLVLTVEKWIFQMLWLLDLPTYFYLFDFEIHDFSPFLIYFLIFLIFVWRVNWGWTKYGIDTNLLLLFLILWAKKLNSNWLKIIVNKEEDESTNGGERSSTKGREVREIWNW